MLDIRIDTKRFPDRGGRPHLALSGLHMEVARRGRLRGGALGRQKHVAPASSAGSTACAGAVSMDGAAPATSASCSRAAPDALDERARQRVAVVVPDADACAYARPQALSCCARWSSATCSTLAPLGRHDAPRRALARAFSNPRRC